MPFYTYECDICEAVVTERKPVAERHQAGGCPTCGHLLHLVITGTHLAPINGAGTGHSGLTKRFIASQRKERYNE